MIEVVVPRVTPPAPANEPRVTPYVLPTARVPELVRAPLTALAMFTVSVYGLLIVIVSALVGWPPVPEPVLI